MVVLYDASHLKNKNNKEIYSFMVEIFYLPLWGIFFSHGRLYTNVYLNALIVNYYFLSNNTSSNLLHQMEIK